MENEIDLTRYTSDALSKLGFKKWDENSGLMLIPLWAINIIPEGTVVRTINGEERIVGQSKLNNDVRFGCLAYGWFPIDVVKGMEEVEEEMKEEAENKNKEEMKNGN